MFDIIRRYRQRRYISGLVKNGLSLGKDVFLNDGFFLDPAHCHLITIEDGVVFGPCVRLFAHDASSLKVIGKTRIGQIVLGKDCFIGSNVTILPGTVIGAESIVGAGSVVSGVIPPQEVWAGVPARKLFTLQEYKERLLHLPQIDFSASEYRMEKLTPESREEMVRKIRKSGVGFMK
jgi:maltose O-acetyltransferase